MAHFFNIKRVETINYYLDYTRDEIIEVMAFCLGYGEEEKENAVKESLSKLSDEDLLEEFTLELDEYGFLFDYIIERSEKYGDVQSQDLTVTLDEERL